MREAKSKYNLHYPTAIPATKQMWIIQEGDTLLREGKEYKVVQVVRPKIAGGRPRIVIQEVENKDG